MSLLVNNDKYNIYIKNNKQPVSPEEVFDAVATWYSVYDCGQLEALEVQLENTIKCMTFLFSKLSDKDKVEFCEKYGFVRVDEQGKEN